MKLKFLFCIWVLSCSLLRAQSPYFSEQVKFKRISISDGLSQSSASAIMQDKKGFLWIGTQDGLNKYNGYTIEHYKNDGLKTGIK